MAGKKSFKPATKKISKRDLTIKRLKMLTAYLTTQNPDILEALCEDEKEAEHLKTRLFNYFLTIPKLVWYIDTYLNGKYDYHRKPIGDWFYTFAELVRMSDYNNNFKSYMHFYKSKPSDRDWFFKLFRDYFTEIAEPIPSSAEINAYFTLYKNHILSEKDINYMKTIVDGKSSSDNSSDSGNSVFDKIAPNIDEITSMDGRTFNSLSPEIQDFCTNATNYIKNRKACQQCPLAYKQPVILDTNRLTPGPVDIAFIGLNPGKTEAEHLLPFIGDSGKILRPFIHELVMEYNLSWMITNVLLCSTNNESDIKNVRTALKTCADVTNIIHNEFPSKIKVLLGDKAVKAHGIEGSITKLSGQRINDYFILCHPSWVLRNKPKNLPKYNEWFLELKKIIQEMYQSNSSQSNATPQTIETVQIPKDRIITRFDKNLTLFDIRIIGETVIFIMKDENNVKKYMMQQVSHPVFVKDGPYTECHNIEHNIDGVCYLSAEEKRNLMKSLYQNMKQLTKG